MRFNCNICYPSVPAMYSYQRSADHHQKLFFTASGETEVLIVNPSKKIYNTETFFRELPVIEKLELLKV